MQSDDIDDDVEDIIRSRGTHSSQDDGEDDDDNKKRKKTVLKKKKSEPLIMISGIQDTLDTVSLL